MNEMLENLKEKYPRWMFMSVVGSQNYGTAIDVSDTDIKVAYLPTFEEFYYGKFTHVDTGSPDGNDYTVHPAHEFLRHAFKGNINFWEVFFSNTLEVNWRWWKESEEMIMFFSHLCNIVRMNTQPNFNAMRGMAVHKDKLAYGMWNKDKHSFYKSAQHAMRMLDMIIDIHYDSVINLDLTKDGDCDWSHWRTDCTITLSEYAELFEEKLNIVNGLEESFRDHHNNTDVRSDRERYQWSVDMIMMKLIKENS